MQKHLKQSIRVPVVRRRARSCIRLLSVLVGSYIVCLLWSKVFTPKYAELPFAVDFGSNSFVMQGKPVQIMSGAMHYFRVLPELWEDRLTTMQASGLNTVETYVEWSSHEPEEGHFDFEGQQDLVRFLRIAHKLGFMVILRPGPYICAERDFGGFPYWLLRNGSSMQLRTSDKSYLFYVDRFLTKVFEKVRPLLIGNGGPVIMVQLENEYGFHKACDTSYMAHLRDLAWAQLGRDVVLFTIDSIYGNMIKCGSVGGVLTTVNFGTSTDPRHAFARKSRHQMSGPLMNSELYVGWVDHWGKPHHLVNATSLAQRIRTLLAMRASFNLYMFHGGTNFGFKAGANTDKGFRTQLTSYDYDAPINEAGDATEKFKVIRDVIAEFFPHRVMRDIPPPKKKMALGKLVLKRIFGLKELRRMTSNASVTSRYPLTFEQVGHDYGFMLYETRIDFQPTVPSHLNVHGVRDRGYVYLDGAFAGIVSRAKLLDTFIDAKPNQTLSILVENQGRVNFGNFISDSKGIVKNVTLNHRLLEDWEMRPIRLSNAAWLREPAALDQLRRLGRDPPESAARGLSVYATTFALNESQRLYDSFLLLDQWTKGVAFLNGFNLGRYWTAAGPQTTLYVPAQIFKNEGNLLVLMELEAVHSDSTGYGSVEFVSEPRMNAPVRWPV
ncbi:beta-galactosidase-like isoform X1 [Dermacentor albipictus]|uniref:beta-galactosidase-like isoform X1 n=2 Tax=Dermacentor albipictus TaxID=60249 RepID=UPI0031FC7E53